MGSSVKASELKTSTHPACVRFCVFAFLILFGSIKTSPGGSIEELTEKQASNEGYNIEEESQTWTVKSGGKESEATRYIKYKIVNSQGWKKVLPVTIPYGWKYKVEEVEIIIRQGSDKPEKIKKKDMMDIPAYSGYELYSDRRVLVFDKRIRADEGTITVSYRLKESLPVLSRSFVVQHQVPVEKSSITIKAPKNWKITDTWRNGPAHGGAIPSPNIFTWSGSDIQPLIEEPFRHPAPELTHQVTISCHPPEKDRKIWAFSTWDDVAEWFHGLYLPQESVTPEMKQVTEATVQEAGSRLEKIRLLYNFVQEQIRYVAVEIGIGGYQPYPAPQTFEKKYGDCKDKATLLCSFLKSVDIKAYPVLVRTRNMGQVVQDFPSPFQFNHCIAYVPASQYLEKSAGASPVPEAFQDGIFLDATSGLCPFGDLPQPDQDTWALIVSDTGGELKKIPSAWLQPNKTVRITKTQLRSGGRAICSVVERNYGIENQYARRKLYGMKSHERQEYWNQILSRVFPRPKCRELIINNEEDLSLPLEIQSEFNVEKFSQKSGNLLIFPAMYWKIFQKNPFTEATRIHPIFLGHTRAEVDSVFLALPEGYTVEELPAATRILEPFGEFVLSFENQHGRSITITRSFSFNQTEIPRDQYEMFRAFIDTLIRKESESIVLKKS